MIYQDNRPLYKQVEASIRNSIHEKKYLPGEQLPTEDELCEMYGVSKITIRKAFKLLTESGLVERLRGKGTFVNQKKEYVPLEGSYGFTDYLSSQGHQIHYTILHSKLVKADDLLSHNLAVGIDTKVVNIKRLMWEDGAPIGIDDFYASAEKYPLLFEKGSQCVSLYKLLEEDYGTTSIKSTMEINGVSATEELSELLQCIAGDPLFVLEKVGKDQHQHPIHYSVSTIRCDRVSYVIEIADHITINSKDKQTKNLGVIE
ncbi:MAG: GntR family transcriptional regulator [Enterococcus avium]